jgi:hypothetical protein
VSKPGTKVGGWFDKSGNNGHMLQTNLTYQPGWSATAINGKPMITFNADSNLFNASNAALWGSLGNMSVFAVFRSDANAVAKLCQRAGAISHASSVAARSFASVTRMPLQPLASAYCAKFGLLKAVPKVWP